MIDPTVEGRFDEVALRREIIEKAPGVNLLAEP
jgi:hypothetical protein